MQEINEIMERFLGKPIIQSMIIIAISVILYRIVARIFFKGRGKTKLEKVANNRTKTYFRMMRSIIRYIFIIVTVLILLQINGVDVSSMLAGVGIASVIIGFAIQDVLKDIIKGIDIISDKYFEVGDIIKYDGSEAKVLAIGLKTTRAKDIKTMNIISIANRNIEQVEVVSNSIDLIVSMPYEVSVEKAEKAIEDILDKVKDVENIEDYTYKGVTELADSSINYMINVHCVNQEFKLQTRRNVLRCILLGLAENDIEVPYNQFVISERKE